MPNIRPSAYLRSNYNEASDFCHSGMAPVFITKNGHGNLAVMVRVSKVSLTMTASIFSSDDTKNAANTLCIRVAFCGGVPARSAAWGSKYDGIKRRSAAGETFDTRTSYEHWGLRKILRALQTVPSA
jgi:hypothetical protein